MVVDVGFVGFIWFVVQRGIEILNALLEFLVLVECQTAFVEDLWVYWLATQSIRQVFNRVIVIANIYVDVASLNEELFV